MNEMGVQPAAVPVPQEPGLSQWQRVANTFVAPQKTFEDIQRGNRSWWLPLIISALFTYILFGGIMQRIGIQQVLDNAIRMNPRAAERLAQATPEQRELNNRINVDVIEGDFIGNPVLGIAVIAILSAGLLGTINFVFGGKATYGSIFAVLYYASLPQLVKALMGTIVIYFIAPESFDINNFAPTNLGAFLDPVDTNRALYALATSMDAVTIWTLVLLSMGAAMVAGVKRTSGYIAVFGWWAIFVLIRVGWAAAMG
jgi:hypothetical protein